MKLIGHSLTLIALLAAVVVLEVASAPLRVVHFWLHGDE